QMPKELSLGRAWITPARRVHLLESPVRSPRISANPAQVQPKITSPVELLQTAAVACTVGEFLPVHAQEFMKELSRRPATSETLTWALDSLRASSGRPASITWNDRLRAQGGSMCTEYRLCQALPIALILGAGAVVSLSAGLRAAIAFGLALVLPIAVGLCFNGGPVFRFMEIAVRRRDGHAASRMRCAWRNFVTWSPIMMYYAFVATVLPAYMPQTGTSPTTLSPESQGGPPVALLAPLINVVLL